MIIVTTVTGSQLTLRIEDIKEIIENGTSRSITLLTGSQQYSVVETLTAIKDQTPLNKLVFMTDLRGINFLVPDRNISKITVSGSGSVVNFTANTPRSVIQSRAQLLASLAAGIIKALSDGNLTTANGTAVDLGGVASGATTLSMGANAFTITGTGVIAFTGSTATTTTTGDAAILGGGTSTIEGAAGIKLRTPSVIASTVSVGLIPMLTNVDGTFEWGMIAAATPLVSGLMSAADKAKLDAATSSPTPDTLMLRDGNGNAQVGTPLVAADIANKGYVDGVVSGLLELKDNINASTNPNYPAGLVGDTYFITVAGKVGGASGKTVNIGDMLVCSNDNAGGNEAAVGADWFVVESNRDQATTTTKGVVALATPAEALAKVNTEKAVPPSALVDFNTNYKGAVTTAGLPLSPSVGDWVFNTDLGYVQIWNGTTWISTGQKSIAGYFINTPGTTVGVAAGVWTVLNAGASVLANYTTSDWDMPVAGRLRYIGIPTKNFIFSFVCGVRSTATQRAGNLGVAKNGNTATIYGDVGHIFLGAGAGINTTPGRSQRVSMATGDYIEMHMLKSPGGAENFVMASDRNIVLQAIEF